MKTSKIILLGALGVLLVLILGVLIFLRVTLDDLRRQDLKSTALVGSAAVAMAPVGAMAPAAAGAQASMQAAEPRVLLTWEG
jgi:lipid-binding SYLF domain-containing protein